MVLFVFIFHLQNEESLRKCYNQQLADAIGTIKGMYQVSFECCQGQEQLDTLGVPSMGLIVDCQSAVFRFQDLSP